MLWQRSVPHSDLPPHLAHRAHVTPHHYADIAQAVAVNVEPLTDNVPGHCMANAHAVETAVGAIVLGAEARGGACGAAVHKHARAAVAAARAQPCGPLGTFIEGGLLDDLDTLLLHSKRLLCVRLLVST